MRNDNISSRHGKILAGLFVIGIGTVLLLKQLGIFFPTWLFTWPVIFIVLGVYTGLKHQFRHPAWFILLALGTVFLLDDIYSNLNIGNYIWPIVIMISGVGLILSRNRRHDCRGRFRNNSEAWKQKWEERHNRFARPFQETTTPNPEEPIKEPTGSYNNTYTNTNTNANTSPNPDDFIDTTSILGGIKKIVLSKNFRGGDIVTFLGGCELNFTQADIQGRAVLDVTQIMGGTRIIVPPHWQIQSEMVAIFGGIEDKRPPQNLNTNPDKILVIKGTSIFGGIDISSY